MLTETMNVIINCAGEVDLNPRLDKAIKVNVTAPLNLLKLAEQSKNF